MINIRQVSNVTKDGGNYTLVNVKVIGDDETNGRHVTAIKIIAQDYPNATALFSAIQSAVVEVLTSGLI